MRKFNRLSVAVACLITAGALATWYYIYTGQDATIPLIDRDDPAFAATLPRIERSMMSMVGRINQPIERLRGEELELVQQLARARLSQTVYEARNSRTEIQPDGSVKILIPAYKRAGAKLEDYIMRDLYRQPSDQALRTRLRANFFQFGIGPQTLTVSVLPPGTGGHPERLYGILHRVDGLRYGPLVVHSGLPVGRLGVYSPFVGSFPPI